MWYIDVSKEKHLHFTIKITINHGLFRYYLSDKIKIFPVHIVFEYRWYRLSFPYECVIDGINPANVNYHIKIQEPFQVRIPDTIFSEDKFIDCIINTLLSWLDEEYNIFQEKWIKELINKSI